LNQGSSSVDSPHFPVEFPNFAFSFFISRISFPKAGYEFQSMVAALAANLAATALLPDGSYQVTVHANAVESTVNIL
jgi:hypothetical protein